MTAPTKSQILALLRAHIESRPGLEFCNYGDVAAYRSEQRRIARQKRDALTLLRAVEWRDSLTAEHLTAGFRAFSGRLTLETLPDGRHKLDYCVGQYYPTEYRAAAAAVLASALWDWARDCAMPDGSRQGADSGPLLYRNFDGKGHISAGDWLRKFFRREFGRTMQSRYFD